MLSPSQTRLVFLWCRFIRLHHTPPLPTDHSAEAEADMAKMMFLIVKRQWRQRGEGLTACFAACGHKEAYLKDLVGSSQELQCVSVQWVSVQE